MGFENWYSKKIGEVITLKRGYDLPWNKRTSGEYPILSSSGVSDFHNDYKVAGPGVTTGRSGLLGKVYYIEENFWPLNTSLYVEDFKGNDPKYVYYLLQTIGLDNYNAGSSVPTLNRNHVHLLEVNIPDVNYQKRIGAFLYSFEEKISLNNKIITNLEQLAQMLFKRWFVDFEFPNENGDPYKSSGGEMVESELGMIPALFKVQFLSQTVEFLSGGTPKTKIEEYWNGDIPFFTPKDSTGSIYETETEKSITQLGLSKCNSRLYPKNTIFITARGTVGKLSMANTDMAMNQSCFALKHKVDNQYFLYFMMETLLRQIIQGSNGAVFNAINLRDLNTLKVVYPIDHLISQFEEVINPIFEMLSNKEYENINLIKLRDTLLPKLLSGDLELPDEIEVPVVQ
ncbi:restriction endonuclease subunit S [Psychrobacillus sp. L3]|uniref:restriction endonuclease subunit S n=1 Tax=Psychrobacillus sp. L3 TaxID=3236891 RepID=UPI0036F40433